MVEETLEYSPYDIDALDPDWSMEEYLQYCGGMDLHVFSSHEEAREFGHTIRNRHPDLKVQINLTTVRLFIETER